MDYESSKKRINENRFKEITNSQTNPKLLMKKMVNTNYERVTPSKSYILEEKGI